MESVPKLAYNQSGTKDYFLYNERGQLIIRSLWFVGSPAPTLANGSPALSSDPELAACCISYGVLQIPTGSVAISQAFLASVYLGPWPIGCGSGDASAKLCESPVATIDARGNQTDYTYDAAHGGVLTETGPAQPSGVRPQTRYTYVQKQARIKDASGNAVATGLPVWLLASKNYCKTSAASGAGCAVTGDEVTTTYDYGPDTGFNNLLLRGMVDDSTGAALRTCYSYDWQGNRISETRPMAGLSACP
jgi:YD repeat-containing protein